ncbi:TetR/AcrR family transcriptional regulator [uncultured Abyssibacter sp.]|uniref:TetR/AcrR family transcriptional regulator n=1 Tax=uncultured Abyssibacter sp. TaxID=2320202 RepID=UPI0032B19647
MADVPAAEDEQVGFDISAAISRIERPDLQGGGTRWTLPRGVHKLSQAEVESSQRARIFYGVVHSVARKGYTATTIADICGLAKLSKTTFYQLFPDKEAAFLAGYEAAHLELVTLLTQHRLHVGSWSDRMRQELRIYLAFNLNNPALAKCFLLEIHAAGARAWGKRDWGHEQFAEMHRMLYERRRQATPGLPDLPQEIFLAVIAAIEELVCTYLRRDQEAEIMELLPRALFLTESIYSGHPPAVAALQLAMD